jgi:hypothetical protein
MGLRNFTLNKEQLWNAVNQYVLFKMRTPIVAWIYDLQNMIKVREAALDKVITKRSGKNINDPAV